VLRAGISARRDCTMRPNGRMFDALGQRRNPVGVVGHDDADRISPGGRPVPGRSIHATSTPSQRFLGHSTLHSPATRCGRGTVRAPSEFLPEREPSLARSVHATPTPSRRFPGHSRIASRFDLDFCFLLSVSCFRSQPSTTWSFACAMSRSSDL
jgi:hypothetical protein